MSLIVQYRGAFFLFSSRRRHTRCALVTGVQTCALPIFAREWHEANAPQWAKVHAAEVIRTLERDVFPAIGSLPIGALNPPKILEVLRAIEARSAIETAKRIRQRISAIYAYAIASGLAETDPAEKVGEALKPLPKTGRQPAITDRSEE